MNKYKLLALDVDDTIVPNWSNEPTMELRNALSEASKYVKIVLATARAKNDFENILNALMLPQQYHVIENGSKLITPEGKIEYELYIPHKEVQAILDVASPYFDEVGLCMDSAWHLTQDTPQPGIVNAVSFTFYDYEKSYLCDAVLRDLDIKYNIYTGRHWDHFEWAGLLLSHPEASKGKGLEYIQKKLGIKKEETIAVGDGIPDTSMFEQAGLRVAMENGEDGLKEKADIIAPSVHKDGVVEIVRKYILSGKT